MKPRKAAAQHPSPDESSLPDPPRPGALPPCADAAGPRGREKSAWWRAVLGEYPTGVSLISSRDSSGRPIGMIVGSFVAISEDPPLVGFLAGAESGSLPMIVDSGRFSVSVLSEEAESFCRAFVQKTPGRWEAAAFSDSSIATPRLDDAVVWFDASIERTDTYGDHVFVVGHIKDFGTGAASAKMPLLFRRAGYGSFAAPGETYDSRAFIERLRIATAAEREIIALANELDVEIAVNTQLGDSVVTLASISPRRTHSSYEAAGAGHPWAAPIASIFAAWAPESRRHAWEEASRHLTGTVDRELIGRILSGVRQRGYAIAGDLDLTDRFLRLTRSTQADRDSYAQMWAEIATSRSHLESDDGVNWRHVAVVQMPVFGPEGDVVLGLYAITPRSITDEASFEHLVGRLRQTADQISQRLTERRDRAATSSASTAVDFLLWGDAWG